MTHADYFMLSICLWREARGEGNTGQLAVACVVRNRVKKNSSSYFEEIVKPWQFTSITGTGDPELTLFPNLKDQIWPQSQVISQSVIDNKTDDITGGATLYYNPKGIKSNKTIKLTDGSIVPFPQTWDESKVEQTAVIGKHIFFIEK